MTRKQFIESVGATCKNWTWSWSFINEKDRFVIFGAWDRHTEGQKALIFSEDWQFNTRKKQSGYQQSRDHISLVESQGFRLMTFPMKYSDERKGKDGTGPAKIEGFTPALTQKSLTKIGNGWYASDASDLIRLAEEVSHPERYSEGAKLSIIINAFERNAAARKACIEHFGAKCAACTFDFSERYGPIGEGFIHVHHVVPIGTIGTEYEIDPIADLIPVCPNCHAMIHQVDPPLTILQLQGLLCGQK